MSQEFHDIPQNFIFLEADVEINILAHAVLAWVVDWKSMVAERLNHFKKNFWEHENKTWDI